jgi:hypothetical protein
MEKVIYYRASDGKDFFHKADCEHYEKILADLAPILKIMPPCNLNCGKYRNVDKTLLQQIRYKLWMVVLKYYGESYPEWKTWNVNTINPFSIVGRVLDDCGGPINTAWHRLMCYDFDKGRQYDQPYYVNHPNEATLQSD